jgi:hypothetical protein
MMIRNKTFLTFGLFLFLIFPFIQLPLCYADVVWSEDFEDGNLDGWMIVLGGFSVEDGTLRSTVTKKMDPFREFYLMSGMYHPSTVSVGTWSFDFMCTGTGECPELVVDFMSLTQHRMDVGVLGKSYGFYVGWWRFESYELYKDSNYPTSGKAIQIHKSFSGTEMNKWHHVDITRNEDGRFCVYVDGDLGIDVVDKTNTESNYLGVHLEYSERGKAFIDNIVVSDSIDIEPPPKKGFNISGFPFESLIIGLVTGAIIYWIMQQRKSTPVLKI